MNIKKRSPRIRLLLLSFFTLLSGLSVHAQTSDFQLLENFNNDFHRISTEIDQVIDMGALREIELEISSFESRYSDHRTLITAALYPVTFEERVNSLRDRIMVKNQSLSVVDQLNSRIEGLIAETDLFRSRINQLNSEISTLQQNIERSSASESRQAALIRQYRQNLESRDLFVADFLEELINRYQNMDSAERSELSVAADRLQDNPVEILKSIISDYIELSNNRSGLSLPDYVSMRAQHGYFSDVWSRIGEQLTRTFETERSRQARTEIDNMLAAWLASVDNNVWSLLQQEFYDRSIRLSPFTNSSELNRSLHEYIDAAYEISLESNREEDYGKYRNFSDFWNTTVKANWGDLIIAGNILTHSDIAAVDVKLSSWGEAAAPISNLMFILLIVSIAVIVGLVVLLVTRKS
ncbi:MAG: hypothetical protein EA360_07640 [Balneolaceae bacterium]|nr:MAG: hypothetical protein EA360_07640 [Balneolaceae bacterium]